MTVPVLLLHAAGGAARNFGTVLRRLAAAGLEAQALDLPGHGREREGEPLTSIDAMVEHVLARAPSGPLLVVGHSMGGAVALALAARAPERVRGVVMLATGARLQMSRAVAVKAGEDFEGFLAALATSGAPPMMISQLRESGARAVGADLLAASGWSALPLAQLVQAPVLLIAGERDRTAPPALLQELANALPRARLVVLEGAGHVLPVERPDDVAREIAAFAAEVAGDRAPTSPSA